MRYARMMIYLTTAVLAACGDIYAISQGIPHNNPGPLVGTVALYALLLFGNTIFWAPLTMAITTEIKEWNWQ